MSLDLGALRDNAAATGAASSTSAAVHVDRQSLHIDGGGLNDSGRDGIEGVCVFHCGE